MNNITAIRRAVIAKARNFFFSGVVSTWSEAMKLGWAVTKFAQKVSAGQPVTFFKKDGTLRVVEKPAAFVSVSTSTTGRKSPAHLFLFIDTEKEGDTKTISCDVRNIVIA